MNSYIQGDVLIYTLSFLDTKSLKNLRKVNTNIKKQINNNIKIKNKIKLANYWKSDSIIELLEKTEVDIKKEYLKYYNRDYKTIINILEKYYNCILEQKISYNNYLFIFIYDIVITNIQQVDIPTTLIYFQHRKKFLNKNNITKNSKIYKFIMNPTMAIDRSIKDRRIYIN